MKKTKVLMNKLIEELEKTPIIQIACDKIGISRNTFYRWMKEDREFLERVNHSLSLGTGLVNDVAISNVLTGIKSKDVTYTKYWLSHKHPDFRRPFIHKVDADDLVSHARVLAEGAKKIQLERQVRDTASTMDSKRTEEAKAKVRGFFDRWKAVSDKQDEKRAQELFEKWKEEESDNKTT